MKNESFENLKSSNDIEKENLDEAKEDIANQLKIMREATDKKMDQAIEHFTGQCEVASEKYLSVNGLLQARSSLIAAFGGTYSDLLNTMSEAKVWEAASDIALQASKTILQIRDEFVSICDNENYKLLPDMLDEYMDKDFVNKEDRYFSVYKVARELTVCSILANLQPNLEDMWEFYSHAQSEMNKLHDELNVKA